MTQTECCNHNCNQGHDCPMRKPETPPACKHRWEESEFGKTYRDNNLFVYVCARCGDFATSTINSLFK